MSPFDIDASWADLVGDDVLWKPEDVAMYLGIERHTVYQLIRDGELYASRIGRQWRIARADIDALVANVPTPTEPGT